MTLEFVYYLIIMTCWPTCLRSLVEALARSLKVPSLGIYLPSYSEFKEPVGKVYFNVLTNYPGTNKTQNFYHHHGSKQQKKKDTYY